VERNLDHENERMAIGIADAAQAIGVSINFIRDEIAAGRIRITRLVDELAEAAERATSRWSGTRAFSIRRRVGRRHGGWWRRWSSTLGSCSPASASS
jgi:hypothetical protein